MGEPTEAEVEAAARALYLNFNGNNPDWPIGVDRLGYRQEPVERMVPAWKWFYENHARVALKAAAAQRDKQEVEG